MEIANRTCMPPHRYPPCPDRDTWALSFLRSRMGRLGIDNSEAPNPARTARAAPWWTRPRAHVRCDTFTPGAGWQSTWTSPLGTWSAHDARTWNLLDNACKWTGRGHGPVCGLTVLPTGRREPPGVERDQLASTNRRDGRPCQPEVGATMHAKGPHPRPSRPPSCRSLPGPSAFRLERSSVNFVCRSRPCHSTCGCTLVEREVCARLMVIDLVTTTEEIGRSGVVRERVRILQPIPAGDRSLARATQAGDTLAALAGAPRTRASRSAGSPA
jgi:hypothetical protein